jgi:signal transduction histidine kinase
MAACVVSFLDLDGVRHSVEVEAEGLEVVGDTGGHWVLTGDEADVTIEVKNIGPAIEKEMLKQIFDPLKRGLGQDNRDDSGAGLGLGLFIVREVARAPGAR